MHTPYSYTAHCTLYMQIVKGTVPEGSEWARIPFPQVGAGYIVPTLSVLVSYTRLSRDVYSASTSTINTRIAGCLLFQY
jgi:hypothetical protein